MVQKYKQHQARRSEGRHVSLWWNTELRVRIPILTRDSTSRIWKSSMFYVSKLLCSKGQTFSLSLQSRVRTWRTMSASIQPKASAVALSSSHTYKFAPKAKVLCFSTSRRFQWRVINRHLCYLDTWFQSQALYSVRRHTTTIMDKWQVKQWKEGEAVDTADAGNRFLQTIGTCQSTCMASQSRKE